jgi:hypothetical protein
MPVHNISVQVGVCIAIVVSPAVCIMRCAYLCDARCLYVFVCYVCMRWFVAGLCCTLAITSSIHLAMRRESPAISHPRSRWTSRSERNECIYIYGCVLYMSDVDVPLYRYAFSVLCFALVALIAFVVPEPRNTAHRVCSTLSSLAALCLFCPVYPPVCIATREPCRSSVASHVVLPCDCHHRCVISPYVFCHPILITLYIMSSYLHHRIFWLFVCLFFNSFIIPMYLSSSRSHHPNVLCHPLFIVSLVFCLLFFHRFLAPFCYATLLNTCWSSLFVFVYILYFSFSHFLIPCFGRPNTLLPPYMP